MKDLSAGLLAHLAQEVTTLAEGWKVLRSDGAIFGFSTHDRDIEIDGVVYRASEGLRPTSAHTTNTLSTDTLDVTAFLDVTTELEMAAGIWDDAKVINFEVNWDDLPTVIENNPDVLVKRKGALGRITRQEGLFTAEIRGEADNFQTRIGRQYSPVCPWRHAIWANEAGTFISSVECQANLAGLGFIVGGSITSVGTDATLMFSDSASTQVDGFYNDGYIHMLTGANAGLTQKVRVWASDAFTLYIPFPYPVAIGSTYRAVRGDPNTYESCKDVYLNIVNFGGTPFIQGADNLYASPAGL